MLGAPLVTRAEAVEQLVGADLPHVGAGSSFTGADQSVMGRDLRLLTQSQDEFRECRCKVGRHSLVTDACAWLFRVRSLRS
jgi:hypothetical protein